MCSSSFGSTWLSLAHGVSFVFLVVVVFLVIFVVVIGLASLLTLKDGSVGFNIANRLLLLCRRAETLASNVEVLKLELLDPRLEHLVLLSKLD